MCRSSFPEISPLICKLAPSRAVEPDGVELSGRMASVLMAFSSVLADAGFATGAGGSGAVAVVGWGISGFLFVFVHIRFWPPRSDTRANRIVHNRGAKHFISLVKIGTRELRAWCSLK